MLQNVRSLYLYPQTRRSFFRASAATPTSRGEIVETLAAVEPFKAFRFRRQSISRTASFLHPPVERFVSPALTRRINERNRLEYGRYEIRVTDRLPDTGSGPIIFVSNHSSSLDPPMVAAAITEYFGLQPWIMAKEELWDHWYSRILFDALGAIPFPRHANNRHEYIAHLEPSASILLARKSLLVFAEGTRPGGIPRNPGSFFKRRSDVLEETGLLPGGPLVPHLTYATGAKIILIGISGTGRAKPPEVDSGLYSPRPKSEQEIEIVFGPTLDLEPYFKTLKGPLDNRRAIHLMNSVVMPALSPLVNFRLHEIPLEQPPTKTPMSAADYQRIFEYEANVERLASERKSILT